MYMHHCGQNIQTANTVSGLLNAIWSEGFLHYTVIVIV